MNESPKYVVSATLKSAEWDNSTIVGPYSAEAIRSLKDRIDGSFCGSVSREPTTPALLQFAQRGSEDRVLPAALAG